MEGNTQSEEASKNEGNESAGTDQGEFSPVQPSTPQYTDAQPETASSDNADHDAADGGMEENPEENPEENIENIQPPNIGLENINVRIDFHIGEISMPVNELASLTPGFTLTDLPGMIFPRAQAIASGRPFAEGELVDIDGKIGFRITRLLP